VKLYVSALVGVIIRVNLRNARCNNKDIHCVFILALRDAFFQVNSKKAFQREPLIKIKIASILIRSTDTCISSGFVLGPNDALFCALLR